jgi:hypothetical protein
MGDLIFLNDEKERHLEEDLSKLHLELELAIERLGPVMTGPVWINPDSLKIEQLVYLEYPWEKQ